MRAIGIILAGGNNNRMRELSNKRAIAAMPIAGSYRSIDFALSNMASSHIQLNMRTRHVAQCEVDTSVASGNRHCCDCPLI